MKNKRKAIRTYAGYTLEDVARECGTSEKTVRRYENGRYIRPTENILLVKSWYDENEAGIYFIEKEYE